MLGVCWVKTENVFFFRPEGRALDGKSAPNLRTQSNFLDENRAGYARLGWIIRGGHNSVRSLGSQSYPGNHQLVFGRENGNVMRFWGNSVTGVGQAWLHIPSFGFFLRTATEQLSTFSRFLALPWILQQWCVELAKSSGLSVGTPSTIEGRTITCSFQRHTWVESWNQRQTHAF